NVSAQDKATGKDQSITIAASSGLSKNEIEKMILEAERFADADREKRELIESSNHAESVIHETEKNIEEYKDQLDSTESENIKSQIQSLKEMVAKAQTGDDTIKAEEIKSKVGEVQLASLKLFEMVYKKRESEKRGSGNDESSGNNEAEYRDVKKDDDK
ncbi:13435_t:CDS:2, partial [Funneliformis caledonium]